jgi:hypothetical protein
MSMQLNVTKAAVVFATVTGGSHLIWLVLVAAGAAQPFINFALWAHFIKPIYIVEPFEFGRAIALLVLTAGIGFLLGLGTALVWNMLHRDKSVFS